MNPKPNKKLSLGAESYGTIAWKGFFTQSQVLLSSIVGLLERLGLRPGKYLPVSDVSDDVDSVLGSHLALKRKHRNIAF